ncbi:MAG: hypothetical protein FJ271_03460 [Planctomycetes bacterium]|nr:hypothetical protein [Planctomycetota bacterium]
MRGTDWYNVLMEGKIMVKIVLTDEQLQLLRQSKVPVPVCDNNGIVLGSADPAMTPEFIAEMKRRAAAPGPRYTAEQVRRHLQTLNETWENEGGIDEARVRQILKEFRERESA